MEYQVLILNRNMGAVLDLAQVVSLLWGSFARKVLSPTPRQIIEHTAPPTFDYATYYNYVCSPRFFSSRRIVLI